MHCVLMLIRRGACQNFAGIRWCCQTYSSPEDGDRDSFISTVCTINIV